MRDRPNTALHRTPAAAPPSPVSFETLGSGIPAEHEGLASVFRIPSNGILVTQDTRAPHGISPTATDLTPRALGSGSKWSQVPSITRPRIESM